MLNFLRAIWRSYQVVRLEAVEKQLRKGAKERERMKRRQAKRAAKYEALRKKYAIPESGRQIQVGGLVEKSGR
jgi:hypothetical protein